MPRSGIETDTPDRLGLPDTLWTRDAVADWAARVLSVRRSRWVWGRWLKAHGFTPQKPARRAYERDPEAVERWLQQEYPRIEREAQAEGAEIHWLDEAGVRSDCSSGRGYAPRGRTPVGSVPGKRFGVNYIAAVTNLGVLRFLVFAGRFTAAVLLARLLARRPGKVRHPGPAPVALEPGTRRTGARRCGSGWRREWIGSVWYSCRRTARS